MTNTLRISAVTLVIALSIVLGTEMVPSAAPTAEPDVSTQAYSAEQQELVDFARARFALAGIDLPDVTIEFPTDDRRCDGWGGLYEPEAREVRICRPSKSTMIHELAHSWAETVLDAGDRQSFLDLRELDRWTGGPEWAARGAEQAAEILTWGLMDEDITVRWQETADDGSTYYTWRLFKLPNSEPGQLIEAFENLTGELPSLRVLDPSCDASPVEIASPEASRGV